MTERLGVGIVGCGVAAQAIHVPTLASLPDLFRVVHCVDPDAGVADGLAERVGCRGSRSIELLLEDPDVDVVCICSPNHVHARQLAAASRAGKRGVLMEKPFALTAAEARAAAAVAREHGTKVVVDTMHVYDPAWRAAVERWGDLPSRAISARARIVLGPNETWAEAQTQPLPRSASGFDIDSTLTWGAAVTSILGTADVSMPAAARSRAGHPLVMMWMLLTTLASHDLALVREVFGGIDRIDVARLTGSRGYDIVMRAGETAVHVEAVFIDAPRVDWSFELLARDRQARVEFPPSFLSAVAGRAAVHDASGLWESLPVYETGYRAAWRDLHRAVVEGTDPRSTPDGAIVDLEISERILRVAAGLPEDPQKRSDPPLVLMGAGVWSNVHMALAATRAPILRVASRTHASAEARGWLVGAEVTTFDDPRALDGAGAAAVIGVPAVHADHTIAALERGIPVLVEKPLAYTVGHGRRIVEAAHRTRTRCVYGENWAFHPGVRSALRALENRPIERVRARMTFLSTPPWGVFLEPDYGGGVLFDCGPHAIELARLFLGRPVAEWVEAELTPGSDVECDVRAEVVIGFAGGTAAEVEVSWVAGEIDHSIEGDGFRLAIGPEPSLVIDGAGVELPGAEGVLAPLASQGYLGQIEALYGDGPILATVDDGLAVLEVIAAAYASAASGRREPLPFAGDPDATPHQLWTRMAASEV